MNLKQLQKDYLNFFEDFKIDKKSGILSDYPTHKFATMPYIGSKYGESKHKILFVGQDIGKDESLETYQGFEERRVAIEQPSHFNPHIAGTYSTALYLLKDEHNWEEVWNKHKEYSTYSKATKNSFHKDDENPLSFVALTNLHKFVSSNRKLRAGDKNRKFLKRDIEEEILVKEIDALKPNLVFFQGKLPSKSTIEKIKCKNVKIVLARHPSYREKDGRKPENYIKTFNEI